MYIYKFFKLLLRSILNLILIYFIFILLLDYFYFYLSYRWKGVCYMFHSQGENIETFKSKIKYIFRWNLKNINKKKFNWQVIQSNCRLHHKPLGGSSTIKSIPKTNGNWWSRFASFTIFDSCNSIQALQCYISRVLVG